MDMDNQYKLNKLLGYTSNIQEIATPLNTSLNTTYFNFVRRHQNGGEFSLSTDAAWTEYFYQKKLYTSVMADKKIQQHPLASKIRIIPWSRFIGSTVQKEQRQHFGIGVGITIIFIHDTHGDFFHFATKNQYQDMEEFYLSNQDILLRFTHYFYDRAKKILSDVSQPENQLYLPERIKYNTKNATLNYSLVDIQNFLSATRPKHYYVYHEQLGDIFITKREYECLYYLTRGKTASEIANMLYRSTRTIETQIKNLKLKLNLPTGATKSDLIATICQTGFEFITPS